MFLGRRVNLPHDLNLPQVWNLREVLTRLSNDSSIVIRGPQHLGFCSLGENIYIKPMALQVAIHQPKPHLGGSIFFTITGRENPILPHRQNLLCN